MSNADVALTAHLMRRAAFWHNANGVRGIRQEGLRKCC